MSARRFDAALFDLDGTLVDSSPLHERAFLDAFAAARLVPNRPFRYDDVLGRTTEDVFRDLGVGDPSLLARLADEKRNRYRKLVDEAPLHPMPGAAGLVRALRADGTRVFVVSSGSRKSVAAALAATGLGALLDGLVTSDDVALGKPDPAPYLACLQRFGVAAAGAVAVEDAPAGVASARAAGIAVFGVFNPALAGTVDAFARDFDELSALFAVRSRA